MSPPYYRGVPLFRLVSVIVRITAQPVLLQYFRTVVDGSRNHRNVRGRAGTHREQTAVPPGRLGRTCGLPSPSGASAPQTDEAPSDSGSCEERSKRPATWITTTRS